LYNKIKAMKHVLKAAVLLILFCLTISVNAQPEKSLKTINGIEVMLHKVLPKESWTSVARTYNLSIEDLKAVNPGIAEFKIGQIVNVPLMPSAPAAANLPKQKTIEPAIAVVVEQAKTQTNANVKHTVKEKETLYGIAKKYNVKVEDIKKWNKGIETVKIGQVVLILPNGESNIGAASTPVAKAPENIIAVKEVVTEKPIAKEKPIPVKSEAAKKEKEVIATKKAEPNPEVKPAESKIEVIEKAEKNEIAKLSKSETKTKQGSVVKEISETGMAAWIKDGSLNQNKYYALHRNAPLGTIMKVNNRMNGDYVFVKVVGQLPDTGDNEKQIIKISEAAAKKIGAINEHFQVELNYGVLN
jgi:LysM repeat protein